MTTIRDVASRSGVSIKTVSRAINAPTQVTARTRGRVMAAVDELDFVLDRRASAMRSGRSSSVGFLSDMVATTPYSVDIIRGAQEALARRGMTMLLANADGGSFQRHLREFQGLRVDGVIIATMFHRMIDALPALRERAILVNCFEAAHRYPTVVPDDARAGFCAARHLIELGHRNIAFVTLPMDVTATQLRLEGFRHAHAEAGVEVHEQFIAEGVSREPTGDQNWHAFETAKQLLEADVSPDAIVGGNDVVAMHIYNAVRASGRSIPNDVSVVGFDDNLVVTTGLMPKLSTVALPYAAMGHKAVEFLTSAAIEPSYPITRIECPLVRRESCRDRN